MTKKNKILGTLCLSCRKLKCDDWDCKTGEICADKKEVRCHGCTPENLCGGTKKLNCNQVHPDIGLYHNEGTPHPCKGCADCTPSTKGWEERWAEYAFKKGSCSEDFGTCPGDSQLAITADDAKDFIRQEKAKSYAEGVEEGRKGKV